MMVSFSTIWGRKAPNPQSNSTVYDTNGRKTSGKWSTTLLSALFLELACFCGLNNKPAVRSWPPSSLICVLLLGHGHSAIAAVLLFWDPFALDPSGNLSAYGFLETLKQYLPGRSPQRHGLFCQDWEHWGCTSHCLTSLTLSSLAIVSIYPEALSFGLTNPRCTEQHFYRVLDYPPSFH